MNRILTESDLRAAAPSIFAESAHHSRSERYIHVPTIDVLERLRKADYVPVQAFQSHVRASNADRAPFTRHLIRLRQRRDFDAKRQVNDVVPEVLLINSHDGTSSFQLDAGLFRLVCSNGLVVKSQDFGSIRVHHTGKELIEGVKAAADSIAERLPQIVRATQQWDKIKMAPAARTRLANKALALRYVNGAPITAQQALEPRRNEDEGNSLWRTYNVLEENLRGGGIDGKTANGRNTKTRSIKSVNNILQFERGLWEMAEAVALRS